MKRAEASDSASFESFHFTSPAPFALSAWDAASARRRSRIDIELPDGRGYAVRLGEGALDGLVEALRERGIHRRAAVVTDETVAPLHLEAATSRLCAAGYEAPTTILPAGERSKSFDAAASLAARLLDQGIERGDAVIALGGGVIGDLTGFVAGILRRGVAYIQAPTTLLAMVDSAVGGKTGINTAAGKNLVGLFHQPAAVIADMRFLRTLPDREIRAGYAEIAKYGAIADASFFSWLEGAGRALCEGDEAMRRMATVRSLEIKAAIVAADEYESGARAALNFGHTYGHALETAFGHGDRIRHGEAVAVGMHFALRLSRRLGFCDSGVVDRLCAHWREVGLPMSSRDFGEALPSLSSIRRAMSQDKKVRDGVLPFIVVRDIGDAGICRSVPPSVVDACLAEEGYAEAEEENASA